MWLFEFWERTSICSTTTMDPPERFSGFSPGPGLGKILEFFRLSKALSSPQPGCVSAHSTGRFLPLKIIGIPDTVSRSNEFPCHSELGLSLGSFRQGSHPARCWRCCGNRSNAIASPSLPRYPWCRASSGDGDRSVCCSFPSSPPRPRHPKRRTRRHTRQSFSWPVPPRFSLIEASPTCQG